MAEGRILLVDSDHGTVRQLASLFAQWPLHLTTAFNRSEAIELTMGSQFDLCIVAHGLKDGNGLELFRTTPCKRCFSTMVLLSRHADLSVVITALDAGFSYVVSTPVDAEQLLPILNRAFPGTVTSGPHQSVPKRSCAMAVTLPDLRYIASLSMADIRDRHSEADLIRIIRSVDYPFAGKERLEYFDRDTLERVVCLVRRWSQDRIATRREQVPSALDDAPMMFSESVLTPQEQVRIPA
jgi:CheY-like chemotaxis protein